MVPQARAQKFGNRESEHALALVLDDGSLVARIQAGDSTALDEVFTIYCTSLIGFARGYLPSEAVAEEIVQEVFCRVWIDRARLDPGTQLRAYLYTAVRHHALNQLRHWRVEDRLAIKTAVRDESTPGPGMSETVAAADTDATSAEWSPAVRRAVGALSEQYRRVLALRAQHGMTYREIAMVLGISLKTAETQGARAIRALRAALGDRSALS